MYYLLLEKENSKPIYKNVITCGAHTLVGGWRLRISHMARLNFDFYLNLFYNIYRKLKKWLLLISPYIKSN